MAIKLNKFTIRKENKATKRKPKVLSYLPTNKMK